MAVLTTKHYVDLATSFISNVSNTKNAYYVYAAKPDSWVNSSGVNDDTAIVTANNSTSQFDQLVYDDLLFGKLIKSTDVAYMIPRYDWDTTGQTVYAKYDQNDSNLFDKSFFVINSQQQVFKVINNNNGAKSTVKPTLTTSSGTFQTADGYTWKYMFSVPSSSYTKFTTTNYIPCMLSDNYVSSNAVPGTIDSFVVTNSGSGYNIYEDKYLQYLVDSKNVVLANTSNNINDYYTDSSLYLKSGYGSGQIKKIVSYNGSTKTATLDSALNTYVHIEFSNNIPAVYNTGATTASQNFDTLTLGNIIGSFSVGDVIQQVDSSATGTIISGNVFSGGISNAYVTRNINIPFTTNSAVVVTNKYGTTTAPINGVQKNGQVYAIYNTNTVIGFGQTGVANAALVASNKVFVSFSNLYKYTNGTIVQYSSASGSAVITGLSNNSTYYIVNTVTGELSFQLATSSGGTPLTISAGTATGFHFFQHVLNCTGYTGYAVGDYIRLSNNNTNSIANSVKNIKRVTNLISNTIIQVDTVWSQTLSSSSVYANNFNMPYAAQPSSIATTSASGTVTDVNIQGVTFNISSLSNTSQNFIVGEKANMVDSANNNLGTYGIIAFANSSTVTIASGFYVISSQTPWVAGNYIKGESSTLRALIGTVTSNPNVTLANVVGSFVTGFPVVFNNGTTPINGSANALSVYNFPNSTTEYIVSPTVSVSGDGTGFQGYSVVNNSISSGNTITNIVVVNPGKNYTRANVSITTNPLYGINANVQPIISPVAGHGYDAITELGARYVGISTSFDNTFPTQVSFRKIGILENPLYKDVTVNLNTFDRVRLLCDISNSLTPGEIIINTNNSSIGLHSNASGVFVASVVNTSGAYAELKNVRGIWATNSTCSDIAYIGNNQMYAISSNVSSRIYSVVNSVFNVAGPLEVVSESSAGASATVNKILSSSQINLTNVQGVFTANDVLVDSSVNAYANVVSIFTSNNTIDSSLNFGSTFSQIARITLSSNNRAFTTFEYVQQANSGATGKLISTTSDRDLRITGLAGGSFSNGNVVVDTLGATGVVLFANTTYLKLTSLTGTVFTSISNGSVSATVSASYPVLSLSDMNGNNFTNNTIDTITGLTSQATGACSIAKYPDLIRGSGRVLYTENLSPVFKSTTSTEQFNLVIKF
jgi:hypothetical protein